ncbi:MAG TPA: glutathione S-transferase family protein [Alphaproteobacteria bacterium]|nr:glutathione S-transferase family protein [Alphaproteobacteria bacterium]
MPTLTLVSHHLCPYVQRAVIALTEKGVPFERRSIDLADKPEWFRRLSPLGKVPLMKVGTEAVLFESAVICEYLEETQPHPLHPSDPLQRALHRAWMEFASAVLADIWGFETAKEAETLERKTADLKAKFGWAECNLRDGPYFAGQNFSLVDAAFGPVFRYFDVFDTITNHGIFADTPKVRAWRRALAARPSVRTAVSADYSDRLREFLEARESYLHQIAA